MATEQGIFITTPRSIGPLQVDATISEGHNLESEVVDTPVEFGAPAGDHIINLPAILTIRAGYSNAPIDDLGNVLLTNSNATRIQAAYEQIINLRAQKIVFEVQTGLRLYRNMAIQSVDAVQEARTAQILDFTVVLKQVDFNNTEALTFPPENIQEGETRDKLAANQERGVTGTENTPTTGETPEAVRNRSVLDRLLIRR